MGAHAGVKHHLWKGGISRTNAYMRIYQKEYRHRVGISKTYLGEDRKGKPRTPEAMKLARKIYRHNKRKAGSLGIKTIQTVYEDNIKKYGTLTCYLCLLPILFGKDNLEHKKPLSRGGLNEFCNLEVACQPCNYRKHNKTEEEYRNYILTNPKRS